MRPALTFAAVGLLAFGFELATGVFGAVFRRLLAGAWSRWMEGKIEGRRRSGPRCSEETRRSRRSVRDRLLGLLLEERITRRSCTECGWRGLSLS